MTAKTKTVTRTTAVVGARIRFFRWFCQVQTCVLIRVTLLRTLLIGGRLPIIALNAILVPHRSQDEGPRCSIVYVSPWLTSSSALCSARSIISKLCQSNCVLVDHKMWKWPADSWLMRTSEPATTATRKRSFAGKVERALTPWLTPQLFSWMDE